MATGPGVIARRRLSIARLAQRNLLVFDGARRKDLLAFERRGHQIAPAYCIVIAVWKSGRAAMRAT